MLTRLGGDSQSSHVGLGVVIDGAESKLLANPDGIGISTRKAILLIKCNIVVDFRYFVNNF